MASHFLKEGTSVKLFIRLVILSLIPLLTPNYSWGMTDAEAINKSGRQRMLSQRMMKSYLMVGADVKVDVAIKQLDASVALFEEQLLELRDYAPTAAVNKELDTVESLWQIHRASFRALEPYRSKGARLADPSADVTTSSIDASIPIFLNLLM